MKDGIEKLRLLAKNRKTLCTVVKDVYDAVKLTGSHRLLLFHILHGVPQRSFLELLMVSKLAWPRFPLINIGEHCGVPPVQETLYVKQKAESDAQSFDGKYTRRIAYIPVERDDV